MLSPLWLRITLRAALPWHDPARRLLHVLCAAVALAGLDWDLVREISADLASALGALHRRAVVHGNFKPMNVVQVRGVWKLIDLKSACDIGSNFRGEAPSTGYCPPEVAAVVADRWQPISEYIADSACDLWALGVVMYHMASGRPLWVMDQVSCCSDTSWVVDASDARGYRPWTNSCHPCGLSASPERM